MRIVFGAGYTGQRVAALAAARGERVVATVRSPARLEALARALEASGLRVVDVSDAAPDDDPRPPPPRPAILVTRRPVCEVAAAWVDATTHAIVCFPPDGETDAALAPLLARARAVSYISSTSVYGDLEGLIDDATALPPPSTRSASQARLLAAEDAYRAVSATILRAPGIYGPDRGLHVRVTTGVHRLPGPARGHTSRIHADDLAALLLASDAVHAETFVVGDLDPAPHHDVVSWICAEHACPLPPTVPPAEVHETLRRNRRIDPTRALTLLATPLRYPSFRDGMRRRP